MDAPSVGRGLLYAGVALVLLGGVVLGLSRWVDLGSLPGDISYTTDNVRIYVPLGTMLVVSVVLTLLVNLLLRFFR